MKDQKKNASSLADSIAEDIKTFTSLKGTVEERLEIAEALLSSYGMSMLEIGKGMSSLNDSVTILLEEVISLKKRVATLEKSVTSSLFTFSPDKNFN